jgi:hypothetical protein
MGGAIYRGRWVVKVVGPLIEKYNLKIDLSERGVIYEINNQSKRTLTWKINFFITGFKMIKFGIFLFLFRMLKKR